MNLFDSSLRYSSHREFIPLIVDRLGIKDMVEVGVLHGALSVAILDKCPQVRSYYLVDPWQPFTDPPSYSQEIWDRRYAAVESKMEQYGNRVHVLRLTSLEAAKRLKPGSLDFVYIDGNHSFKYVDEDIKIWWSKVRSTGCLAGHDIKKPRWPGVLKAVEANFGERYYCGQPTGNWDGVWIVDK